MAHSYYLTNVQTMNHKRTSIGQTVILKSRYYSWNWSNGMRSIWVDDLCDNKELNY